MYGVAKAWIRWQFRDASLAEPRCGACQYIILPGSATTCPECGNDVRDVGIIIGRTMPPPGVTPWLVLSVLGALPIAAVLASPLAEAQPFGRTFQLSSRIRSDSTAAGAPDLLLYARGSGRHLGHSVRVIRVDATHLVNAADIVLEIDDASRTAQLIHGPAGVKTESVRYAHAPDDLTMLIAYFARALPRASGERHVALARRVQAQVAALRDGQLPPGPAWDESNPVVTYRISDAMYVLAFTCIGTALFTIGYGVAQRFRRGRLRHAQSQWRADAAHLRLVPPPTTPAEAGTRADQLPGRSDTSPAASSTAPRASA